MGEVEGSSHQGRIRRRALIVVSVIVVLLVIPNIILAKIAYDNIRFDAHHPYSILPDRIGVDHSDVEVTTEDGLTLAGWWMPANMAVGNQSHHNATVIMVHGIDVNMAKVLEPWVPNVHGAGYNILTIDLRNHGKSDDDPSGQITYGEFESRDVLAAIRFIRENAGNNITGFEHLDPDRVVIYGESMGAATVLMAAARTTDDTAIRGVIADSPYSTFEKEFWHTSEVRMGVPPGLSHMAHFWVFAMDSGFELEDVNPVDGLDILGEKGIPYLLTMCDNDLRLDPKHHDVLVEAGDPGLMTHGTWHCDEDVNIDQHVAEWAEPGYNETILSWLDENL